MATDIAFALGILSLLGSCVPVGLKLFLTALAITDDLGAVLVIAVFYTDQIRVGALLVAVVLLALLVVAQRLRIRRAPVYAVLAVGVWLAVVMSGVHATVAGILVAMVVPVRPRIDPKKFLSIARDRIGMLESNFASDSTTLVRERINAIEELHSATGDVIPAGLSFEHYLHPVTAYVIIPLFALFNAGVALDAGIISAFLNPVSLGVLMGLFVGKQWGHHCELDCDSPSCCRNASGSHLGTDLWSGHLGGNWFHDVAFCCGSGFSERGSDWPGQAWHPGRFNIGCRRGIWGTSHRLAEGGEAGQYAIESPQLNSHLTKPRLPISL